MSSSNHWADSENTRVPDASRARLNNVIRQN
jgi:hypothetical protein